MLDGAKSAKFVRHTRKNIRLSPHNRLIENLENTVYCVYVYNRFCKKVNDKDILAAIPIMVATWQGRGVSF